MKKRLLISFIGGRTSEFMLWWLMNKWEDRHLYDIIVVFANTGKEVEGTLFFVDEVAQEFNIPVVWVEGYPSDKGKGWAVNHKIVTYETASRNGEPFEAMIKKLGIPCSEAPFCSDQLKRSAIESYLRSIGWENGSYDVAIGIRIDEPKRYKTKRGVRKVKKNRILPLVDIFPVDKKWILTWWKQQTFDLDIHEDDGNCDNCWKKSDKVLYRNAIRKPKSFNWWQRMTDTYQCIRVEGVVNFFRKNRSPKDIICQAQKTTQEEIKQQSLFDEVYACGESCEPF